MESRSIMFVVGDPSGDIHTAPIIRKLKEQDSGIDLWGIGGPQMVKEGFKTLMPFEPFNKMGFIEVASHLPFFLKVKKSLIEQMKQRSPSCLVCVDYPGLNMIMMKAAHELGIPVVWYIAPMVWAWKRKRAKVLSKYASQIGCIFPFEVEYFLPYTKNVHFVGNPLVESIATSDERSQNEGDQKSFSIAIVPGSRIQEVKRILPPMLEAYKILKDEFPFISATVSHFPLLEQSYFQMVEQYPDITLTTDPLRKLISKVDAAFVTSGTATLEAALLKTPMVIVYKTSQISYAIYKSLVKVQHIGLPNIIANKEVVPECIQNGANPARLAEKMRAFISDKIYYSNTISNLVQLQKILGSCSPSEEVAKLIDLCRRKS